MPCVPVPPTVAMTQPDSAPYHKFENYVTLECTGSGRPTLSVYWEWQACSEPGCIIRDDAWKNVEESRNLPIVKGSTGQAELLVKVKESGFYQCSGVNKRGRAVKQARFVVAGMS